MYDLETVLLVLLATPAIGHEIFLLPLYLPVVGVQTSSRALK